MKNPAQEQRGNGQMKVAILMQSLKLKKISVIKLSYQFKTFLNAVSHNIQGCCKAMVEQGAGIC